MTTPSTSPSTTSPDDLAALFERETGRAYPFLTKLHFGYAVASFDEAVAMVTAHGAEFTGRKSLARFDKALAEQGWVHGRDFLRLMDPVLTYHVTYVLVADEFTVVARFDSQGDYLDGTRRRQRREGQPTYRRGHVTDTAFTDALALVTSLGPAERERVEARAAEEKVRKLQARHTLDAAAATEEAQSVLRKARHNLERLERRLASATEARVRRAEDDRERVATGSLPYSRTSVDVDVEVLVALVGQARDHVASLEFLFDQDALDDEEVAA